MKFVITNNIPEKSYKSILSLSNKKHEKISIRMSPIEEGNWDQIDRINSTLGSLYSDYGIYELHPVNDEYLIVYFDPTKTSQEYIINSLEKIIH